MRTAHSSIREDRRGVDPGRHDWIFRSHTCQQLRHTFRLNDFPEASFDLSTVSAAQFEFEPQESSLSESEAHAEASLLKRQAAERLAAHRARRERATPPQLPGLELTQKQQPETRAARIAAAVAERYAHSQSYRAFLAAEAERAIQQAEATAEIAARTAEAVVAAQQQLLSELADWSPAESIASEPVQAAAAASLPEPSAQPERHSAAALTVRHFQDVSRTESIGAANNLPFESLNEEERLALDEEIAFRHSPQFEEFLEPAIPLPANLIEFPRQLVASRKARPRLAEGPLREDADSTQDDAQLRIFEVEASQISTDVLIPTESTLPEWSSIRLSASPAAQPVDILESTVSYAVPFMTAPLSLRLMSALVDGCIVVAAFLGFTTVFAYTAGQLPKGQTAALGAIVMLAALALSYQLLFFTFSDATPGMRYARISLCTFSDDNPTRSAMRRRIVAVLLAACPAGLGFLWAWLDDDRLGWHDRISRMYQRSY
jgi:uncharacterized RDD family membrane protein YckC